MVGGEDVLNDAEFDERKGAKVKEHTDNVPSLPTAAQAHARGKAVKLPPFLLVVLVLGAALLIYVSRSPLVFQAPAATSAPAPTLAPPRTRRPRPDTQAPTPWVLYPVPRGGSTPGLIYIAFATFTPTP